jgi:hypothetical protein
MGSTQDPFPQTPSPEAVRDAVAEVFADSALQDALQPRGTAPEAIRNLLEWLWGLYTGLIDQLNHLRISAPGLYWLAMLLLLAVLGLLIWHICWTFSAAFRSSSPAPRREAEETVERTRRYREERRRAGELASRGEYAEAARALLLALLALLDEQRILPVARGWTNREILARLGRRQEFRADLGEFGRVVERASYGDGRLGSGDFERLQESLDRIVAQVGRTPQARGEGAEVS